MFRLLPLRQDVPRLAMFTGLPDSHFIVQDFFECKEPLVPHLPKCWVYKCVHISAALWTFIFSYLHNSYAFIIYSLILMSYFKNTCNSLLIYYVATLDLDCLQYVLTNKSVAVVHCYWGIEGIKLERSGDRQTCGRVWQIEIKHGWNVLLVC